MTVDQHRHGFWHLRADCRALPAVSSPAMGWVSFVVLGLPLESFSDRLHSRCKLFFDLRMNPDADTQDLAGIYQLEAAVFVQNADYTFAMMSAASGCDQVALVNLDNPAIGKLERECFERRA